MVFQLMHFKLRKLFRLEMESIQKVKAKFIQLAKSNRIDGIMLRGREPACSRRAPAISNMVLGPNTTDL